jgi:hypothetical protein
MRMNSKRFVIFFHYCPVKKESGQGIVKRSMLIFVVTTKTKSTMGKSTNFIGQPLLNQLLFFVSGVNIRGISKRHNAERYVKKFDTHQHNDSNAVWGIGRLPFYKRDGYRHVEQCTQIVSFGDALVWFVAARCPMPTNGARVLYLGTSILKI